MIADGSCQAPAQRHEPDTLERLALALIFSVALHAVIVAWPAAASRSGRLHVVAAPAPLLAHLIRNDLAAVPPPEPVTEPQPAPGRATRDYSTAQERQARFAAPPVFLAADSVPLTAPVQVKLRIHVAPSGAMEMIDTLESGMVPAEFLAAVREDLERARFQPAESSGRYVPGTFTLVIEAGPLGGGMPGRPDGARFRPLR